MTDQRARTGHRLKGVVLPASEVGPFAAVMYRLILALCVLLVVVVVVLVDRGGYRDTADGNVSVLDAVYYATVTASTTGYGDITPVSGAARLINVVVITPLRVLFLIILVGTTLEVLATRTREDWRLARWRSRLRDHTVVAGYGTKGRSAVWTLVNDGTAPERIVVVDPSAQAVAEAKEDGFAGVVGDATRAVVLRRAEVERASQIIVATQRDETAVLVTLTARQLNATAPIFVSVREEENAPLLRQSGADHVVTSSAAAGRLLGVSTIRPNAGRVLEDLMEQGSGLDLIERRVAEDEVGRPARDIGEPAIAVVRAGEILPFDAPGAQRLADADRLIVVRSRQRPGATTGGVEPGRDTGQW